MSQRSEFRWQIEARIRRQQYLARVEETTRRYYERYRALYDEMVSRGDHEYIPNEMAQARADLDRCLAYLSNDPDQAREMSYELGEYITRLPALARAVRRQFEEQMRTEALRRAEAQSAAKSEFDQFLDAELRGFTDPAVRDFSFHELQALRQEYRDRSISPEQVAVLKQQLAVRIQSIRTRAEEKAATWKEQKQLELQSEAVQELIAIHRAELEGDQQTAPDALAKTLGSLAALQKQLEQGRIPSLGQIKQQVAESQAAADEAVVDERCRREAVKGIVASLQKNGFVLVGNPKYQRDRDEVVVMARRPAGNEAEFRIKGDGSLQYKFDHYEGSECKQDITKVQSMMEKIYGVKLSDERVLWANPDRIGREARSGEVPGGLKRGE